MVILIAFLPNGSDDALQRKHNENRFNEIIQFTVIGTVRNSFCVHTGLFCVVLWRCQFPWWNHQKGLIKNSVSIKTSILSQLFAQSNLPYFPSGHFIRDSLKGALLMMWLW